MAAVLSRFAPRRLASFCLTVVASTAYFQLPDLFSEAKGNMYNVLWVLVFGFATINIAGLVFRPFDTRKMGLTFGEIVAITVVLFSIVLFGLELLGLLHIFPIRLTPR